MSNTYHASLDGYGAGHRGWERLMGDLELEIEMEEKKIKVGSVVGLKISQSESEWEMVVMDHMEMSPSIWRCGWMDAIGHFHTAGIPEQCLFIYK